MEMKMRNKIQIAVFSAVLATVPVAQAARAAEPVGGCSDGFQLMTVKEVLKRLAAPGFEATIKGHDRNGDGYLCVKISDASGLVQLLEPNTPFLYTDNNVQGDR
jgi:hypothetical protein